MTVAHLLGNGPYQTRLAVATEEQEALRREVPASPQLSSAAATPDLSLMMMSEGNTVDLFDQMGVSLPAYARKQ